MKKSLALIYLLAIAAMIFWGFSFVWVKIVYEYLKPFSTVFVRLSSASIILLIFVISLKIKIKPEKGDMKYFFMMSLAEPFLYFLGESFGLLEVSSTFASVMISTIPLFALVTGYLFLKERLGVLNILGIFISFIGILVMILEPDFSMKESPKGIALMLLAVLSAVFYTLMVKKLSNKYKPITILAWQNFYGVFLFLPFFLYYDLSHFLQVKPDFQLVSTLLQLVVFASILAFFFYIKVVDRLGISRANVFTNFVPVVTAISAWLLLPNEGLSAKTFGGIFIVIIGIFFSQIKSRKTILTD